MGDRPDSDRTNLEQWRSANSGQALDAARDGKVSCALVSMKMPGTDGLDLLPKLLEINPAMGIVMVSENDSHENIKKAISLGAYGNVMKPFDLFCLELTVASRLTIAASN